MPKRAARPSRPDSSDSAYASALAWLARRELSERQVRERLRALEFVAEAIDDAVARLQATGAIDDRRVALAHASKEASVRHRGRDRVRRQLETMGIAREVARRAVDEAFAGLDEAQLIERALGKRLRAGMAIADQATFRRLHAYLLGQGFEPAAVMSALRSRAKSARFADEP